MSIYEIISVMVATLTLIVGIWLIQRNNIKEFQKLSDRVAQNRREISQIQIVMTKEIDEVKKDRQGVIGSIVDRINRMEMTKESDNKEIAKVTREANEKIANTEMKHHEETMKEIRNLSEQLTSLVATFVEYRRTRNGDSSRKNA
jgi:hypothetical protein